MCDSASKNTQENIDLYIKWLSHKLRSMANDILCIEPHNWLMDVEVTISQYRKYMKNAVNFNTGAHLCDKYLYGSIGLHEFCAEMVDEDLKEYLIDIPHLPSYLMEKFNLTACVDDNSSTSNDGAMGDGTVVEIHREQEVNTVLNDDDDVEMGDVGYDEVG